MLKVQHGRASKLANRAVTFIDNLEVPKFPVNGHDLLEKAPKLVRGPWMGHMLTDLKVEWAESDFSKSKKDLLDKNPSLFERYFDYLN